MESIPEKRHARVFRRAVFILYLLAVLAATLAPLSSDTYAAVSGLDKLVHVALLGGVALLLCWNLARVNKRGAIVVIVATTLLAAAIELIQSVLWYRSGDFWDFAAGAFGALLGVGTALLGERL